METRLYLQKSSRKDWNLDSLNLIIYLFFDQKKMFASVWIPKSPQNIKTTAITICIHYTTALLFIYSKEVLDQKYITENTFRLLPWEAQLKTYRWKELQYLDCSETIPKAIRVNILWAHCLTCYPHEDRQKCKRVWIIECYNSVGLRQEN